MLFRYTLIATFIDDKKYLLMQLLAIPLYSAATLRINRVTLWEMALVPVALAMGAFCNEYWAMRPVEHTVRRKTVKAESVMSP